MLEDGCEGEEECCNGEVAIASAVPPPSPSPSPVFGPPIVTDACFHASAFWLAACVGWAHESLSVVPYLSGVEGRRVDEDEDDEDVALEEFDDAAAALEIGNVWREDEEDEHRLLEAVDNVDACCC